jgi:hypothetical protein
MLSNVQGASALSLLAAASAADTAAATGVAVDISGLEGPILVVQDLGDITGAIVGKLQTGDLANGTDAADITGATFGAGTEAGISSVVIDANQCKKYLRYLGTVTTGPAVVSVVAIGKEKYV